MTEFFNYRGKERRLIKEIDQDDLEERFELGEYDFLDADTSNSENNSYLYYKFINSNNWELKSGLYTCMYDTVINELQCDYLDHTDERIELLLEDYIEVIRDDDREFLDHLGSCDFAEQREYLQDDEKRERVATLWAKYLIERNRFHQ